MILVPDINIHTYLLTYLWMSQFCIKIENLLTDIAQIRGPLVSICIEKTIHFFSKYNIHKLVTDCEAYSDSALCLVLHGFHYSNTTLVQQAPMPSTQ